MGIIDIVTQARELSGSKIILNNALQYANSHPDGKGEGWGKWKDKREDVTFTKPIFRTVTGWDHTYFALDLDTYPEVRLHKLLTKIELREIRLRAVYQLMEEIIQLDDNLFCYTSGKGGYMIRRVEPQLKKGYFLLYVQKMLEYCSDDKEFLDDERKQPNPDYCKAWEDEEEYTICGKWHELSRKLFRWQTIETTLGTSKIQMAIDLNLITKEGKQVFRMPYSLYNKIAGYTFICAPVIWDEERIDVEESLKQTDPLHTVVQDYAVPIEIIDVEHLKGVVVDPKALQRAQTRGLPAKFVKHDIPHPNVGLTVQQWGIVNKMEELLIGTPEKTPPCIKNAYRKSMPNDHMSRVVFGRYLLHKGYNPAQIGTFIRFKVNDHEDNSPDNLHQLDRNLYHYITPTERNARKPASCKIKQKKGSDFYSCTPEDAKTCGRPYVLVSSVNTKAAKAMQKAIRKKRLIPDRLQEEVGIYGKFDDVIQPVIKMLDNNDATLVKKTTRAGLTTSLIVGCLLKKMRLLVLEPTNRIPEKTFPAAMDLAKDEYHAKGTGAVLANNPRGCLKLKIKANQLAVHKENNPTWGDDGLQWLKLPVLLKPRCEQPTGEESECEFYHNTFPTNGDLVNESRVTSIEGDGEGLCARITVMRNLTNYNIIFATYAKMSATVASDTDQDLLAYSDLSDYDVILLDEISTLVDGQPSIIEIAGIKNDKIVSKGWELIRAQFAIIQSVRSQDYPTMEQMIETCLDAMVEAINNLKMDFIRNGKKTIRINNPLSTDERDQMIRQYAIVQYAVEHSNRDLSLLANFILTLSDDEWYLTAITNLYNFTSIKLITKPEITLLRRFLTYMQRKGKKIMVTDASLPPMSMEVLLRIQNIKVETLGDPRDTNAMSLLIPDTKKINVTDLILKPRRGENRKPLNMDKMDKMIGFMLQVIEKHGASDVTIVLPNSGEIYHETIKRIKSVYPERSKDGGVKLTYYRSDQTVGIHSERRTMIVACKPLPPEDSFDWLATHYAARIGDEDNITGLSNMFREHSAKQSFYQTVGRAKDPAGAVPSVIYCYGIKINHVHQLLRDYDPPVVLTTKTSDVGQRLTIGTHWRRTGDLLDPTVIAAVNLLEKRGRMKKDQLQYIVRGRHFEFIMKNLSIFGIEFNTEDNYLYFHRD